MILIYAEKADVGSKIAAALDKITLEDGTIVTFEKLGSYGKKVNELQKKQGYLMINFKGKECMVTWGYGHMCTLKRERDYNPEYANWRKIPMPFFPPMEIKVKDDAPSFMKPILKKQLNVCRTNFPKAEYIINATDDDREGELIFYYLYEYLRCKTPVKRTFLSSQTKKGYLDAFNSIVDNSTRKNIIEAGKARSESDFMVGTNLTTALTLKNPNCGILSCGRVQTTILNMIVERDLAIKNFVPKEYFTIEATLKKGEEFKSVYEKDRIDEKTDAEHIYNSISSEKQAKVIDVVTKPKKVACPELYSLSALQMDCNILFKLSLKQTLDIAQSLYDGGYTTYPRTKSRYLNNDKKSDVLKLIDMLEKSNPEYAKLLSGCSKTFTHPENHFDDKKVLSHFAIIPTGKPANKLTGMEAKVYDLIARSVIRMVLGDAEVSNTTAKFDIKGKVFVSKGKSVSKLGWMATGRAGKEKFIPDLTVGEILDVCKVELCEKYTQPPNKYNDNSLVEALNTCGKTIDDEELRKILSDPEHAGVGTEATRAAMVETLEKRGYIERDPKKNTISATKKGYQLISYIPIQEIKSPEMTAMWEKRLMQIEAGKDTLDNFIADVKKDIIDWLARIEATAPAIKATEVEKEELGSCPRCGKPVVETKFGYGCSGYKEGCKFSDGTMCGKKITKTNVKKLLKSKKTGLITGFKSKKGSTFDAYLIIDESGEVKFEFKT